VFVEVELNTENISNHAIETENVWPDPSLLYVYICSWLRLVFRSSPNENPPYVITAATTSSSYD
jgi:hypothetical protein